MAINKKTLPIFGKNRILKTKLWSRRIIQYIKMTQDIDISMTTTDKEKLQDRNKMDIRQKYTLFGLHSIPEGIILHSRADFVGEKRG